MRRAAFVAVTRRLQARPSPSVGGRLPATGVDRQRIGSCSLVRRMGGSELHPSESEPAKGYRVEFRLLGPLEACLDGQELRLGGPVQRCLLAIQCLHVGQVVPADRLIEDLWGDERPSHAKKALQVQVFRLRQALEPGRPPDRPSVLLTQPPGYLLQVPAEQIDIWRFEQLAASGRRALERGEFEVASNRLRDALALWRTTALADFAYEQFAQATITRLEELRASVQEDRVEAQLGLGRHSEVVSDLRSLVRVHPLRERLWQQLMVALYRSGQHAAAIRAYQDLRHILGVELGLEPSPGLARLEEAILLHKPELDWNAQARSSPALEISAPETGLGARLSDTAPLSSFVGREKELAKLAELLQGTRLLTLVGAGGCGKTRIALELASCHAAANLGPVHVVELASVEQTASVLGALAGAMGTREQPGRDLIDTAVDRLGVPGTLLVVDNCEHLLTDVAMLAERLLRRCPALTIVATSRSPLRAAAETTWRVPSMATPEADEIGEVSDLVAFEAIRLFVERAVAVQPDFVLSRHNAAAVVMLCRRLDGMPLAIELAAARVGGLSVGDIADRLDDRFRLLVGGSPNAAPRQQTLRAAIDWSYRLLSREERELFAALSVFAGRFTLEGAEAVGAGGNLGCVATLLHALVEKSLVLAEVRKTRFDYRLLETVRQYASERLHESGAVDGTCARHAAHYLALAEDAEEGLRGRDAGWWRSRLDADLDNMRAAFAWFGAHGGAEAALRMVTAVWQYFYLKGQYALGKSWLLEAMLWAPDAAPAVRARANYGAGALSLFHCEYENSTTFCQEALRLFRSLDDLTGVARSLTILGSVAREECQLDSALALHTAAMDAFTEVGDSWGVAHSLELSALALWLGGDTKRARRSAEHSLALFRSLDAKDRIAWALLNLGAVALYENDHREAEVMLQESLSMFRRVQFKEGIAWTLNLLGVQAHRQGNEPRAEELLTDSLILHLELGDRWREASVLEALAAVAGGKGDLMQAGHFLGSSDALRAAIRAPVPPCERPELEQTLAAVVRELGQEALAAGRYERRDIAIGGLSAGDPPAASLHPGETSQSLDGW